MFNRRMFCSSRIPQTMFRSLKISSVRQASHILPPLVVMPSLLGKSSSALLGLQSGSGSCSLISDDGVASDFVTPTGIDDVLSAILAELWRPCGVNMAIWLRLRLDKSTARFKG